MQHTSLSRYPLLSMFVGEEAGSGGSQRFHAILTAASLAGCPLDVPVSHVTDVDYPLHKWLIGWVVVSGDNFTHIYHDGEIAAEVNNQHERGVELIIFYANGARLMLHNAFTEEATEAGISPWVAPNCFIISRFGSPPRVGITDWEKIDRDYVRVDGQLLNFAFVFPIEHLQTYTEAAVKFRALQVEAEELMTSVLNVIRCK